MYEIRRISKQFALLRQRQERERYSLAVFSVLFFVGIVACGVWCTFDCFTNPIEGWLEITLGSWNASIALSRESSVAMGIVAMVATCVLLYSAPRLIQAILDRFIKGLELKEPITANHGETIEEVIRNLRFEPVEYLAFFDPDGRKIGETTLLNAYETKPTGEIWQYIKTHPGCIEVHNHPNSSNAFSSKDFRSAIFGRIRTSIVIAGPMVYTMTIPEDMEEIEGQAMYDYYEEHWKKVDLEYVSKDPLASQDVNAMASIMMCRDIADQYDIDFTAEPYKTSAYAKAGWSAKKAFARLAETDVPACADSQTHNNDTLPH